MIASSLLVIPLPDNLAFIRIPWLPLSVIFFSIMTPSFFGILSAWFIGFIADLLQGDMLGQNAVALSVITYLSYRFHLQIRVFPIWQMMIAVLLLLSLNELILLWVKGISGQIFFNYTRWIAIVIGALIWPIFMTLLLNIKSKVDW